MSLRKAIAELRALLAQTPDDPSLVRRLAEALQKQGELDEAAATYARLAETDARDGHFLKAVALFKQVLKLDPERGAVRLRLAQLHAQLGLLTEAVAYLRGARTQAQRDGDAQAALAATVELSVLEPIVPNHRVDAARQMLELGQLEQARSELWVAERLLRTPHPDLAQRAATAAELAEQAPSQARAELEVLRRALAEHALLSHDLTKLTFDAPS